MKIGANEINNFIEKGTDDLYIVLTVENLEELQNIVCQEIVDIKKEGNTLVAICEHEMGISGRGMFVPATIMKEVKEELINKFLFPYVGLFSRVDLNKTRANFILLENDGESYIF